MSKVDYRNKVEPGFESSRDGPFLNVAFVYSHFIYI